MKSTQRSPLRHAVILALITLVGPSLGCINFAEQTLTYRFDASADRLLVYQHYAGIFADGGDTLSSEERDQLLETWSGQRTFLFDNWVAVLDLDRLARPNESAGAAPEVGLRQLERQHVAQLARFAGAHIRISNGPFFRDREGRLSAVQRVRIDQVSAFLPLLNTSARMAYLRVAGRQTGPALDRLLKVAALSDALFEMHGNRVTMRWPSSADDFDDLRDGHFVPQLQSAGGFAALADGLATATFGREDSEREQLTIKTGGRYRPNVVDFATDQWGVASAFDPIADADRFFASSGADR